MFDGVWVGDLCGGVGTEVDCCYFKCAGAVGGELVSPLALGCLFRTIYFRLMAEILQLKELASAEIGQTSDVLPAAVVRCLGGVRASAGVSRDHDYIMDVYHFQCWKRSSSRVDISLTPNSRATISFFFCSMRPYISSISFLLCRYLTLRLLQSSMRESSVSLNAMRSVILSSSWLMNIFSYSQRYFRCTSSRMGRDSSRSRMYAIISAISCSISAISACMASSSSISLPSWLLKRSDSQPSSRAISASISAICCSSCSSSRCRPSHSARASRISRSPIWLIWSYSACRLSISSSQFSTGMAESASLTRLSFSSSWTSLVRLALMSFSISLMARCSCLMLSFSEPMSPLVSLSFLLHSRSVSRNSLVITWYSSISSSIFMLQSQFQTGCRSIGLDQAWLLILGLKAGGLGAGLALCLQRQRQERSSLRLLESGLVLLELPGVSIAAITLYQPPKPNHSHHIYLHPVWCGCANSYNTNGQPAVRVVQGGEELEQGLRGVRGVPLRGPPAGTHREEARAEARTGQEGRGAAAEAHQNHLQKLRLHKFEIQESEYDLGVSLYYQFMPKTLREHIEEMALRGEDFTEKQLFSIIYGVESGLQTLYGMGIPHGCLNLETILFKNNIFKITDISSTTNLTSYELVLQGNREQFLSEKLLNNLALSMMKPYEFNLADDLFSLGLIILMIIARGTPDHFYAWHATDKFLAGSFKMKYLEHCFKLMGRNFSSKLCNKVRSFVLLSKEEKLSDNDGASLTSELQDLNQDMSRVLNKIRLGLGPKPTRPQAMRQSLFETPHRQK